VLGAVLLPLTTGMIRSSRYRPARRGWRVSPPS